ncbi:MAG: MBOAT family protein [Bacteroidales bacterium]|nr:MBOAT family protein [Bacteroidales bacterium]
MVFSSIEFLFYFLPVVLLIYYLVPKVAKNLVLLVASLIFYAWGAPDFFLIFIVSMLCNFLITKKMHNAEEAKPRKRWLALSLVLNIGLLAYFKYMNFFVDNLNALLSLSHHATLHFARVALPIGISFFTFQSISYTVDVYRKVSEPLRRWYDYMLYISLFPQLIAGPIIRYNTIAEQLVDRTSTMEDRVAGFRRFVIGLSKKVLIANTLAILADEVFAMDYHTMSTGTAWMGIIAYTFQIYFDFSGYSDMAIGIGRMLGFRFSENFNVPYISQSISEFWRRWHMTLGGFMKEYLYIPLGGNRVSKGRTYFNLWIVFLISGLWHGASWTFVLWGVFHGTFLILDRLFMLDFLKKIGRFPAIILTFFIVVLGWVLFRAETVSGAIDFYQALFTFRSGATAAISLQCYLFLALAFLFAFIPVLKFGDKWMNLFYNDTHSKTVTIVLFIVTMVLFFLSVGSLAVTDFNPFIYFRF